MSDEHLPSDFLFSLLLHLYPKRFRDAYGKDMRLAFRDSVRAARRKKRVCGLIELWVVTLADLIKTALEERLRQMLSTRAAFPHWAGPLTVVVGVLWMVSALGDLAFQVGLIVDDSLASLVGLPFLLSFIPLLPALVGTWRLFQRSVGIAGRLGLLVSVLACAGMLACLIVGSLAHNPSNDQPTQASYGAFVGFIGIRFGLLLFGVDCLNTRPMPRWNGLPLLVGATVVMVVPFDWFGVPALVPGLALSPLWHFSISGVSWILFGIGMIGQAAPSQPTVDV